jgi:muramoyltetrapeptide carboxypeptidase
MKLQPYSWLIAPSKFLTKKALQDAIKNVSDFGYVPLYDSSISTKTFYLAGSVKRRTDELHQALFSKEGDVIFSCWGGYGSMELLDHLNWEKILSLKNKKSLIGSSDITALLLGFYTKGYKGILVHGQMPSSSNWFAKDFLLAQMHKDAISGKSYKYKIPKSAKKINISSFNGEIVGGNLRILTHMIGSKYELNTKNKILFIEDTNERAAAIYNMLLHLEMAGKLFSIKALLIGKMTNCGDYLKFVELFCKRFSIPVIYELPLGHNKKTIPIRMGDVVTFDNNQQILTFKRK